jgi:hypothetical protein
MVTIPVSIGELIDKLSILRVKQIKILDCEKLSFINKEFELLYSISYNYLKNKKISNLYDKLINTNSELWDVEDKLRVLEISKDFSDYFIYQARQVYYINDKRFLLKDKINKLTSSEIKEVKSYVNYNYIIKNKQ